MWRPFMACLALAIAIPASAHDPAGIWDDWFVAQRNKRGVSCCELSHAHVLNDDEWTISGKRYQVRFNGQWFAIEDWQLLRLAQPNPTGKAILWYLNPTAEPGFYITCFTPSQES